MRHNGGEAGAGHDSHDAAIEWELEQDWANRFRGRVESAGIANRASVEDEPERKSEENHAVDVEVETACAHNGPFVEKRERDEQRRDDPGVPRKRR